VGEKPFMQYLFHLLITAKVVSSYNISEWTKHVIIWRSQVRTVSRNLQHHIFKVLVEVNSGWVLHATMQHPLRCDIPIALVKITKLNSRRLKVKTQLYYINLYIYIYIADDGNR